MIRLRRPWRLTLQAQLVTVLLALFTLITLAIGTLIVARLHESQLGQLDAQLAATRVALATSGHGDTAPGPADSQAGGGDSLRVDMLPNGTLLTRAMDYNPNKRFTAATVSRSGQLIALTDGQINELKKADLGSSPKDVDLGGTIGQYRLIAVEHVQQVGDLTTDITTPTKIVTIVGLPTAPVSYTVRHTAISVALLSLAGLIVLGVATAWFVRRATAPLRRVAATATHVSQLPLSTGEVVMHERVAPRDTDRHTEVGQVGAALNEMLDHVDSALTARQASETQVRQFVADASHELRTPLASIRGYAELSRRESEPVPEGVTHALGRIESEARRMTMLVEDLLLLARLDSGRPLERAPVDLTRLLLETVSDLRAAGPEHVWKLDLPDSATEVIGDEARLRQVLINLLANARSHTPPGTTVTAGLAQAADTVRITVHDNGPGIPSALLPRIFERFTRGDEARTRAEGSTGLGLSIVSAVVAAHHGHVAVSSGPGSTTFTITLPKQPAPATPPTRPALTADRD